MASIQQNLLQRAGCELHRSWLRKQAVCPVIYRAKEDWRGKWKIFWRLFTESGTCRSEFSCRCLVNIVYMRRWQDWFEFEFFNWTHLSLPGQPAGRFVQGALAGRTPQALAESVVLSWRAARSHSADAWQSLGKLHQQKCMFGMFLDAFVSFWPAKIGTTRLWAAVVYQNLNFLSLLSLLLSFL